MATLIQYYFQLGVEDNGVPTGLSQEEMQQSMATLQKMAQKLGADVTVLREREGVGGKVAEVLLRRFHMHLLRPCNYIAVDTLRKIFLRSESLL